MIYILSFASSVFSKTKNKENLFGLFYFVKKEVHSYKI